jgi:endogenous inhibitor of DNA gyrase (YacG/DUF329 family)
MSLCPICKKREAVEAYKPFCTKRCADLDLGQWLDGGYAIPTIDSPASTDNDGLDG